MDEDTNLGPTCHVVRLLMELAINVPMVLIGVQYDDPLICKIQIVPQFLQISGGIMIGFAAVHFLCGIKMAFADDVDGGNGDAVGWWAAAG